MIIPALDLRGGRAVRYLEGEERRETIYSNDPVAVADRFWQEGAQWLHVVDMDRAFQTGSDNSDIIAEIARRSRGKIQLGGGVRSLAEAERALNMGADRVVITTAMLEDAPGLRAVLELGASRFAVALDTRNNRLTVRRTGRTLSLTPAQAVARLADTGVETVLFRDLDRDGRLEGADLERAAAVAGCGVDVLLAGGVSTLEEIRRARDAGIAGTIVGRALYEGRFTLRQALAC